MQNYAIIATMSLRRCETIISQHLSVPGYKTEPINVKSAYLVIIQQKSCKETSIMYI